MASESPSFSLDSHEMRCLSVVKPMTFLMAAEFDIFLAATKARDAELKIVFPPVQSEYRKALQLCANRFQLTASGNDCGPITITGVAVLPLLRYSDFLPGLLHLDEILSVGQVRISRTEPKSTGTAANNSFEACCIDYKQFDDEPKFEAASFYNTIDKGLPMATMAHLIRFEVSKIASASEAVKSFQRFSHWNQFDLRWDDEESKRAAVIVMPSTADVHEIFDRYEDEDTGDDAPVLFRLRPVAPCAHVPYLEDALIRRLREHTWDAVVASWAADPRNRAGVPVVVVSNLAQSSAIQDLLAPFGKANVVEASLVMESGPHKRRKLYLQLDTPEAARSALALDGQRIALPGKPVVRVTVAPPYMTVSRRGHLLSSTTASRSPSPQAEPVTTPGRDHAVAADESHKSAAKKARRGSEKGKKEESPGADNRAKDVRRGSPQAAPTQAPADNGRDAHHTGREGSAKKEGKKEQPKKDAPTAKGAKSTSPAMGSAEPSAEVPPMVREYTSKPDSDTPSSGMGTKLNSDAAPFVPGGNSSFGAMPPPPYNTPANLPAPPPYVPPPAYGMPPLAGLVPPPYRSPPAYSAPPPYLGGSPQAGPANAPPPPPYNDGVPPQKP
jgi:hypothetical protein